MKLEENSKLCIDFIIKNKLIHKNININNTNIIDYLRNIISSKNTLSYELIKKTNINKIHNTKYPPLMYVIFLLLFKNNLLDEIIQNMSLNVKCFYNHDIDYFIEWYNENQMSLSVDSIKNILKNNTELKELYDIVFDPIEDRQHLHHLLYSNPFVPLNIQYDAECQNLEYSVYKFNNGSVIYLYKSKYNVDIDIISKIFDIFNKISNKNMAIKLIIYLSDIKKEFYDNSTKILKPVNINSGSTIREVEICLWRFEEIYKVLIHELIHYYNIDFGHHTPNFSKTTEFSNKLFNLVGEDRLYESYTECLANIIHCAFFEYYSHISIDILLTLEISFSLFQIAKILHYFNFNNAHNILKKNNIKKNIIQSTSACSYFIIKGSLLFSINDFLHFINDGVFFNNKINQYLLLIEKCLNENYLDAINKYFNYIELCNNLFVGNTLRMTCLQLIS